jgi:hypothetical protein
MQCWNGCTNLIFLFVGALSQMKCYVDSYMRVIPDTICDNFILRCLILGLRSKATRLWCMWFLSDHDHDKRSAKMFSQENKPNFIENKTELADDFRKQSKGLFGGMRGMR